MRRVLLAVSVAVAALPSAALADHTCAEVSGMVNTSPFLGECDFSASPAHNCHTTGGSSVVIDLCLPRTFGYASTAR